MTSSQVHRRAGSGGRRRLLSGPRERAGLRGAGRAGFVARGIVYVLVGALAIRIAFGGRGGQADRQGALHEVASQPFGAQMLWILVVGFGCMALWRASLAVLGEAGNTKPGKRLLNAARAAFYASVCWGTAAFAAGSGSGSGSDTQSQDWTAHALKLPAGRFLVGVVGVAMIAVGVGVTVRALRRHFLTKLDTARMSRRTRDAVTALGLAGGTARGAVLAAAGVFVLVAAATFDPHRAKGLDATLRSFAQTPAGPWLLVLVALGVILFGGFSFASARWRKL
ncbi:DUF1206 domain-containing protein [Streptacidiphilus carbonis]|uniref:DUF1206 domain-containing protein n=1 Tax=Streptacidiphilus carbonis TaxID=105422 RepID=UPI0005AB9168|nr:DUF1206 domain-containing protein [Streptacidiphilus carbonis]